MERLSDDGVIAAGLLRRVAAALAPVAPVAPESLAQSGVPEALVEALVLKHLQAAGEVSSQALAARLALPWAVLDGVLARLRAQRLLDIPRRGRFDTETSWTLTDLGRTRALDAMERCAYTGPAPVPLADYITRIRAQSRAATRIDATRLRERLGDAVVDEALFEALGTALNSERALFLHGPSGTGKTYLAERLGQVVTDPVWVPHAVLVDGELVQVFDERVHRRIDAPVPAGALERAVAPDPRWAQVARPVVMTGGELTLEMLELQWDPLARFYVAPPQIKAMHGVLVVDDLGRQRVAARDLINRWIVPLDRRVDEWALHTGAKFQLPFDVKVVFSSNLAPEDLGDPAFVRRMGYKLPIGAMKPVSYQEVVRQACARVGLADMAQTAASELMALHRQSNVPLYAAVPQDLISVLRDRAEFRGEPLVLDAAGLHWAWSLHFPTPGVAAPTGVNNVEGVA